MAARTQTLYIWSNQYKRKQGGSFPGSGHWYTNKKPGDFTRISWNFIYFKVVLDPKLKLFSSSRWIKFGYLHENDDLSVETLGTLEQTQRELDCDSDRSKKKSANEK